MKRHRVKYDDLIVFFAELERMARSNVAWQDGLGQIAVSDQGTIARLAETVAAQLRQGAPLSQALRDSVRISPYAIALLRAGEESGAMADALSDAALMYRRMRLSRRAWASAARYPAMVFLLFILLMIFLSYTVIPRIGALYEEMYRTSVYGVYSIPLITRVLMGFGEFVRMYGLMMLLVVVVLGLAIYSIARTQRGRLFFSNMVQLIPFAGRALAYDATGRFCRALGLLLERRVPVDAAIMLAAGTAETVLSQKMAGRMCERIRLGGKLWEGVADSYVLPPAMVWMIQKAEEHGDAASVFQQIAGLYDDKFMDVNDKIKDMIEPVLLIVIGMCVMYVLGALYLPMFSYFQLIG